MSLSTLNKLYLITLIILSSSISAQSYIYKTYSWEKQPTVYKPTVKDKEKEIVLVKDHTIIESAYDKDGQAAVYETHHYIYHVNSEKGVGKVNKVYIPTGNVNEELDLNARCITANNKIIMLNPENIKKIDNLDDNGPFTIFSIEGVEVGCDVEYYYTNKNEFYSYAHYRMQNKYPIKDYSFKVISPKNLVYETKSYNGVPPFEKDTSNKEKNIINLQYKDIDYADEEKYSNTIANKPSFTIQLAYNTDKSNAKFYTWETIAKNYFNNLFFLEKKEQKLVEIFLSKNKISKIELPEEKIIELENSLKLSYSISDEYSDLNFEKSISEKKLSESNAIRLYISAFKIMKIPFELVLTSDRIDKVFDSKFPSYTSLTDVLFYFPDLDKYVSPTSFYSRLGFQNPNNIASEGLFIKEILLGDVSVPSAKIKQIAENDYRKSYHNITAKVKINTSSLMTSVNSTQDISGYLAYYTQPLYDILDSEKKLEINKSYYLINKPDLTKNVDVRNTDKSSFFKKPFQISYTQELPDIIENAGDKFIFKVGELIGAQSELYEEKKRITDADIHYTHYLKRILEIEIPNEFVITNADEIKSSKKCIINEKYAAQFWSDYTIEGNKIIITIYEDYQVVKYPLANYPDFQAVINAAADFNKKTLVFEKR